MKKDNDFIKDVNKVSTVVTKGTNFGKRPKKAYSGNITWFKK